VKDLLPNFAYRAEGHLFERPPTMEFTQEPERDSLPKLREPHSLFGTRQLNAEYQMQLARHSQGAVRPAHAEALVEVLGQAGLHALLSELRGHVGELIELQLSPYVTELQRGLPQDSKLPSYAYGPAGCYGYFELKLKDLAGYEELHSGVLQNFRRLGNAVALLLMLDAAVQVQTTSTLLQLPPRRGEQPLVTAAEVVAKAHGENLDESDTVEMARQAADHLCPPLGTSASLLLGATIDAASKMSKVRDTWLAGEDTSTDLGGSATTKAFHRVWSSVQFLFCTVPFATDDGQVISNEALFGDAIPIAGALCLHFLGQRHRFELFDFAAHVFAVHTAAEAEKEDPVLDGFIGRYRVIKAISERTGAMLDASNMPTCFNVWRYS